MNSKTVLYDEDYWATLFLWTLTLYTLNETKGKPKKNNVTGAPKKLQDHKKLDL